MFPLNAIPAPGNSKFQVFYASGGDWQIWQKPAGCTMIYIFTMAGGGGGGRPANGATTVGGGGGGSSAVSRVLIPAILLPDAFYIQVGVGGAGATTAGSAGSPGTTTYVQTQTNILSDSRIVAVSPGQGGAASTTGGAGGTASTATLTTYASLGLWYTIAGQAGSNGSSVVNVTASNVTPFASGIITTGGTGGGNGFGSGGNILAAGFLQQISGSNGTFGFPGASGFQRGAVIQPGLKTFPLLFTGGIGGGGHSTGTAGRGGDGSYGGGGGGGGGCSGAGTSGNGGNGGDGLVIIGTF